MFPFTRTLTDSLDALTHKLLHQGRLLIGTAGLADNAVTSAKILDSAVTSAKVLDGTIAPADLSLAYTQMFAVGSALAGSAPAPSPTALTYKIQAGTLVFTTDAAGNWTFTFPTAFPNGLLSVVVSNGDTTITDAIANTVGGTASGTTIRMEHGNGAAINAGLVRVNWIAIGW